MIYKSIHGRILGFQYNLFNNIQIKRRFNYSDVTELFTETVNEYELFPAWVYYDSHSARYFVEKMTLQGFNMVRCIQGAKTLSLPMQMLGADLQAHRFIYYNNPILKWCLTNTGIQTDRNGIIVPIKNQSPRQ